MTMPISRRTILTLLAAGVAGGGVMSMLRMLRNPCRDALPPDLAEHPMLLQAWSGIEPQRLWDCHAHLAGVGASDSGIVISESMQSWLHPLQYAQLTFYLDASCVGDDQQRIDQAYIDRLSQLLGQFPPGAKIMLFAFDYPHDEQGRALTGQSALYVPDAWALRAAQTSPQRFEWVCSIHPYRSDAVAALEQAARDGARAVKWLPAAMGMDPASPLCDPFYEALVRLRLPLIVHCGEEKAVHGVNMSHLGNPLRLRRPLDHGVRIVVAHCASIGEDADSDNGGRVVATFDLFSRLMDEPRYEHLLFGDISAITLRNRSAQVIRRIIENSHWRRRLLNGSDYPLPAIMPLVSPTRLHHFGLLPQHAVAMLNRLQEYNPLLFDFVLKRSLRSGDKRLDVDIFHTRDFFLGDVGADADDAAQAAKPRRY